MQIFLRFFSVKNVYGKEIFMERYDFNPEGRIPDIQGSTSRQDGRYIYSNV